MMSAFVMDERFFDQLASELYAHATLQRSSLHWTVENFLRVQRHNPPASRYQTALQEFVQQCYRTNVEAVNQRYGDNGKPARLTFIPASGLPKWSDVQLFKYLECLSYQCAEGDVPESAIYKELESLIGQIARAIVGKSDEYEQAKWDYVD